jgi:hypothetical protein
MPPTVVTDEHRQNIISILETHAGTDSFQHKDTIVDLFKNDLPIPLSDIETDIVAHILSVRTCRITKEQGQSNINTNGLIIRVVRSGISNRNERHQVVFKHTPSGIVILEGEAKKELSEAISSFLDVMRDIVVNLLDWCKGEGSGCDFPV